MKKFTKLLGIVLIMALVMSMGISSAFAASISVKQDSTYAGEDDAAGRNYTYKEIFHATLSDANTSTGGGYDEDGTPGTVTASLAKGYSYFLNATETTQIGQLGTWVPADPEAAPPVTAHWEKATGNNWFKLTPSGDGSKYIVEWDNAASDADTAQAAAKWLSENYTAVASGNLTWDSTNKKWTATNLEDGYYLLTSDSGNNLVAATGDIQINEKNSYPPLDKTQSDEDNATKNNDTRDVAIGDVLNYDVKVTIPATAKVGDKILVYDNKSVGLTYNNDVAVSSNTGNATVGDTDYTGDGAVAGAAWQRLITVTEGSQGKDVVFSFTMTVNESSLVDTGKANESALKYGPGSGDKPFPYEGKPDKVEYKTYFTGIKKIDGSTKEALANVEFTLKEGENEFKVSKPEGKDYYIYDANGSATVKTDENGMIKIRGLDEDKTYTLTETKTLDGYNLLDAPKTLTLSEDTYSVTIIPAEGEGDPTTTTTESYTGATNDSFDKIENNKGAVLPSTGGIGTTIFYVVGSILVVAAGVLLITKKRMSREG
jgi:fimbrial isopeptide formation D2 family protein/LPXTG-motif cell wall-anchored protein